VHNFALGKDILQRFLLMEYIFFFCFYAAGDDCYGGREGADFEWRLG
jgi:hypothetical protein